MKHQRHSFLVLKLLSFIFCFVIFSCQEKDANTPGADDRDPFIGNWVTAESSQQFGNTSFTITISKSSSDNENVIIKNFYNLGVSANAIARVNGTQIELSSQQVSAQQIAGKGTLSNGKINWNYVTDDGVQKDTCTALSSK
jgi:hypothetical protein